MYRCLALLFINFLSIAALLGRLSRRLTPSPYSFMPSVHCLLVGVKMGRLEASTRYAQTIGAFTSFLGG